MKTWNVLIPSLLLAVAGQQAAAQGVTTQTGPVLGQTSMDCSSVPGAGDRPVIDGASARLQRTKNGITASFSMPTPVPGSYCYPPATLVLDASAGPAVPGHPEAFSFWAIYFNNPEACLGGECSVADVLGPNCVNVLAGAVKLAGHVVGGPTLHTSGHLSVGEGPLTPFGCAPLLDPQGAEIHLAMAPHGMLRPDLLPDLISTPPGGGPGYWMPSVFEGLD